MAAGVVPCSVARSSSASLGTLSLILRSRFVHPCPGLCKRRGSAAQLRRLRAGNGDSSRGTHRGLTRGTARASSEEIGRAHV